MNFLRSCILILLTISGFGQGLHAQEIIPFASPDTSGRHLIKAGRLKATLRYGYLKDNPEAESLRERIEYNPQGMPTTIYKFGNNGGVERKIEYEYDGTGVRVVNSSALTLNPNGDMVESLFYRFAPNGSLLEYHRESEQEGYSGMGVSYDPEGRILVRQYFEKDRLPGASELYGYDEKGHLTSIVHRNISGKTMLLIQIDPDAKSGRPIKESHWYEGKALLFSYAYRYDLQGRLARREKQNRAGEISSWDSYEYNEHGKVLKHLSLEEGEEKPMVEQNVYDRAGRVMERKVNLPDGEMFQWTRFRYDSTGTGAGFERLDKEGRPEMEEITIYDHQGRKKEWRMIYFDGSGEAKSQYRYDGYGLIMEEKQTATDQEQAVFWFVHERY